MTPRHCAYTLALMALATPLSAQGTPAPAAGMPVRWSDTGGTHTGQITTIMPDGSFAVDLRDPNGLPLAFAVVVDPRTTPSLEVRVAHQSHRGFGALIGGVAGILGAKAYLASKPQCLLFDEDSSSCARRAVVGIGATVVGMIVGSRIAGESSTWIPARGAPPKEEPGVTVRPLLTWQEGPAVGIRVRF